MILIAVISFLLSMNNSSLKTKVDRDAVESAKNVIEKISGEIRSAKSIYTPTTTSTQLSLETSKYLVSGENSSFVDFFMCGSAVCFKKEGQDAVALTPNSVVVTNLLFVQISTGTQPSVQVSLTTNAGSGNNLSSITLTSTASLRSY